MSNTTRPRPSVELLRAVRAVAPAQRIAAAQMADRMVARRMQELATMGLDDTELSEQVDLACCEAADAVTSVFLR